MDKLLNLLDKLGIKYQNHEHPPLYTVEDIKKYDINIPRPHCKNLLLKDEKKNLFLIVTLVDKTINLKIVQEKIGSKRLSFASKEILKEVFDLEPGSVTPFGIMNDKENLVTVVLDKEMMDTDYVNFHPLTNTATITITPNDLQKFLNNYQNKKIIITL